MISTEIEQMIEEFFNKESVKIVKDSCKLFEDSNTGLCECEVLLEEGILFESPDNNPCKYLLQSEMEMADYIIFQSCGSEWVLNVIEIKKTMDVQNWKKTKRQINNAYIRALGFAKILGIDFTQQRFVTIYHEDAITKPKNLTQIKAIALINSIERFEHQHKNLIEHMRQWILSSCKITYFKVSETEFDVIKCELPEVDVNGKKVFKGKLPL